MTAGDSTDTTITASPSLTLDKQAGLPSGNTVGSTIAYTFVLTNTGNVTLHSAGVTDPTVGTVNCPETTLAPGATTVCTTTYTLTQADVDAGHVPNTATGSAVPPTGAPGDRDGLDRHDDHRRAVDDPRQAGRHADGHHGRLDGLRTRSS